MQAHPQMLAFPIQAATAWIELRITGRIQFGAILGACHVTSSHDQCPKIAPPSHRSTHPSWADRIHSSYLKSNCATKWARHPSNRRPGSDRHCRWCQAQRLKYTDAFQTRSLKAQYACQKKSRVSRFLLHAGSVKVSQSYHQLHPQVPR